VDHVLRDVAESDLDAFYEHQREPEATAMALFPERDREAFYAHWRRLLADDSSIKKTIVRLRSRRAALFERLTAAVDEVATVYAGLLEVSATARTMGVSLDDTEVGAVNDAVTLLQITFAELEADAANLPSEDLYH